MIEITEKAEAQIKHILAIKQNMSPLIVLKHGGCSGNILAINLEQTSKLSSCDNIDVNGIKFYIDETASHYVLNDLVLIDIKSGLEQKVIVRNLTSSSKCKCGRSF